MRNILTESDIRNAVQEVVGSFLKRQQKYLNEFRTWDMRGQFEDPGDSWYDEEDYDGNVGKPGMVRSYEVGDLYLGNVELAAEEEGYKNVADYLRYWASEVLYDCPWYWQKLGNGYGFHGTTIFEDDNIVDGHLVCKEIYDQIMFDAYPPANGASGAGALAH